MNVIFVILDIIYTTIPVQNVLTFSVAVWNVPHKVFALFAKDPSNSVRDSASH